MERTSLLLEGVSPDDVTTGFLVAVMDAADEAHLDLRGVSVRSPGDSGS